jgi:hypothetical protein
MKRQLTDEDVKKYIPMVDSYIRKSVLKNWNEASLSPHRQDVALGNTGMSIRDIRQYLLMEVCIALNNYNPNYVTKEGRSVKESTFIFTHIYNRGGQILKKLTKRRYGYGMWTSQIEQVLGDIQEAE